MTKMRDRVDIPVLKHRPSVGGLTGEPDWKFLIPDQLGQKNSVARTTAKRYWDEVIESLKENGTYTKDCLETVKALVLYRVRFDVLSTYYFAFGEVMYDPTLNKNAPNSASDAMDKAQNMVIKLSDQLGLTPKSRDKAAKVHEKKQRKEGSSVAYLKPVQRKD